jgi:hypothetical protein
VADANATKATLISSEQSASDEFKHDEPEEARHEEEDNQPHLQDDGQTPGYGILDNTSLKQAQARLTQALQQFADKLGQTLEAAVDNATSLEVSTYVSDDLSGVNYDKGRFGGNAKLRALTRINLDGDTLACVPADGGDIDESLWKIHLDMVQRAQANRAELIKAVTEAAAGLLGALKTM